MQVVVERKNAGGEPEDASRQIRKNYFRTRTASLQIS